MTQMIGYTALVLNLISMSMKDVFYLRILSLAANAIYLVYGLMIDAPPLYIGCIIAVSLHSYHIYKHMLEKKSKKQEEKLV